MNNRPSSVTATIITRLVSGWMPDTNRKRKTSHLCRLHVEHAGGVPHLVSGEIIELRINVPSHFAELPPLPSYACQVVLVVKPVRGCTSKGKASDWYYILVPRFGLSNCPQPALIESVGHEPRPDLLPMQPEPKPQKKAYFPPSLDDEAFRMPRGLSKGERKRYRAEWRKRHPQKCNKSKNRARNVGGAIV